MITRLSRNQKQNKRSVFLGCVLIIVGKHAETESLIKIHFKRKHFSEDTDTCENIPSQNGSWGKL